jgi:hypothetical protein
MKIARELQDFHPLELGESDKLRLRSLLSSDDWKLVERIVEHTSSILLAAAMEQYRDLAEAAHSRGVWSGYARFEQILKQYASESPEAHDEEDIEDAIFGGSYDG